MKSYRMMSTDIRDSQSPQDTLACVAAVTITDNGGSVTTPFKKGTKVAYSILHEGEIGADGVLTFDTDDDTKAGILVLGKAQATFNDIPNWE